MFPIFPGSLHHISIHINNLRFWGDGGGGLNFSTPWISSQRERKPTGQCGNLKIAAKAEGVPRDLIYWLVYGNHCKFQTLRTLYSIKKNGISLPGESLELGKNSGNKSQTKQDDDTFKGKCWSRIQGMATFLCKGPDRKFASSRLHLLPGLFPSSLPPFLFSFLILFLKKWKTFLALDQHKKGQRSILILSHRW